MFPKAALFVVTLFVASAVAAPTSERGCGNVGQITCCNNLQTIKDYGISELSGIFGLSASELTGQAGLVCNPITAFAVNAGGVCPSSPVCCKNVSTDGLVAMGCTSFGPIY